MEVNSISFFAFLGLSSVIYRYTKKDNAAIMLIAVCNILFYLAGGRMYIPVLLFVVGASYLAAIHVEKCKESDKIVVCEILEQEMSAAATLLVELKVDAHSGKNWLEAKE